MNEGHRKAISSGLEVKFMCADVSKLARQDLLSQDEEGFDLITCAPGLVLLNDPRSALGLWASFLAPCGKLIVDVPVEEALLGGTVLAQILEEAGIRSQLLYSRDWITSIDSLREAVSAAGLVPMRVFETPDYLTSQYDVSEAPDQSEKLIKYFMAEKDLDSKSIGWARSELDSRIMENIQERGRLCHLGTHNHRLKGSSRLLVPKFHNIAYMSKHDPSVKGRKFGSFRCRLGGLQPQHTVYSSLVLVLECLKQTSLDSSAGRESVF